MDDKSEDKSYRLPFMIDVIFDKRYYRTYWFVFWLNEKNLIENILLFVIFIVINELLLLYTIAEQQGVPQ